MQNNAFRHTFAAEGCQLSIFSEFVSKTYDHMRKGGLHTHEWYELFYFNEDNIDFFFEDRYIHLQKDNILIVPPGTIHSLQPSIFALTEKNITNIQFTYKKLEKKYPTFIDYLGNNRDYILIKSTDDINAIFRCYNTAINKEDYTLACCLLFSILSFIVPQSYNQLKKQKNPSNDKSNNDESRIFMIDTIIQNHFNDCTPEILAHELNISPRQLARIINKQYGCSFKEYVNRLKIRSAKFLAKSGKSSESIATLVGYSSARTLNENFKKQVGMTIKQYKESHKSK